MNRSPMTAALRASAAAAEAEYSQAGLIAQGVERDVRRRRAAGLAATAGAAVVVVALTLGTTYAIANGADEADVDPASSPPPGTTAITITESDDYQQDPAGVANWCGRPAPSVSSVGEHVSLDLDHSGSTTVTRSFEGEGSNLTVSSDTSYSLTLGGERPAHVFSSIQWLIVDSTGTIVSTSRDEWFIAVDVYGSGGVNSQYPLLTPGEPLSLQSFGPLGGSGCGSRVAELPEGTYSAYPVVTSRTSDQTAARGQFDEQAIDQFVDLEKATSPTSLYTPGSWDCRRFLAQAGFQHPDCGDSSPYDPETGKLVAYVPDELLGQGWTETLIGPPTDLTIAGVYSEPKATEGDGGYTVSVGSQQGPREVPEAGSGAGYSVADIPLTCGSPYEENGNYVDWPLQIATIMDDRSLHIPSPKFAQVIASSEYDGHLTFVGDWDVWLVSDDASGETTRGVVGHATAAISPDAAVTLSRFDGPARTTIQFRDSSWCVDRERFNDHIEFAIVEGPGVHVDAETGEVTTGTFRFVVQSQY